MKISVGNSRMDKHWNLEELSVDEFSKKLSQTKRTAETVEQFKKMTKAQQDNIKDVGGFVAGMLKGGRRKKDTVISRSAITLDADYAPLDFPDMIEMFCDFRCVIYSTHKHTAEKPRLRLIIPLLREVTPDEYIAVSRKIAEEIGIEYFDDTTYEPSRLMYWASTSADGEFVFKDIDGVILDPDKVLAKYKDWRNAAELPVSNRQEKIVQREIKNQADPLEKKGIIGAFCRTYTVTEAIDRFISDIYKPSAMDGRYDYIPADSSAGVVIYDDKFAYSHHATDPACGKLMNAFDVVRLHKFGGLDSRANEDTEPNKLPSFKAMQEFAADDDNVKSQLAREREEQAKEDFKVTDDWQKNLEIDKKGNVKDTLDNIVAIIRHDEGLKNIAFNKHRDGIDARGGLPWEQIKSGWSDSDYASIKVYLSHKYDVYSPTKTKDAILAVASERAYHPIQEYLDGLPEWDGVHRVETLLVDYFGAEDNSYTRAVIRKTMCAAVARIYNPGTKFDSVLILNGPQGIGKGTFFAKLAGEWFSDSLALTDMKDKSGPEKLQGYWILELGELAGMKKADVETVKSFITRTDDKYRASYGVNVENHPRQCVIVGSTNAESGFLRDITGNRRFWPVKISGDSKKKSWQITDEEVKQIWAETLVLYKKGEKLYLDGEDINFAVSEQANAMESDEREGLVRAYLDTLLPDNWGDMSLYDRRNYLNGSEFGGDSHTGTVRRTIVCNMEIWCECFGREPSAMKTTDSYAISAIMKKIEGWEKTERTRFKIYGLQRAYRCDKRCDK